MFVGCGSDIRSRYRQTALADRTSYHRVLRDDAKMTLAEIRAKHRAKWLAEQEAKRERSLGRLTPDQENWLAIALAHLQRLFEAREVSKPNNRAFCIFEVGKVYVQFLAYWDKDALLCEAVSEKFVSLTSQGKSALRRLGFSPPDVSPNYSQTINIKSADDLGVAVRLAFRVFTKVFQVTGFSAATFREILPSILVCTVGFDTLGDNHEIEILCERAHGIDRVFNTSMNWLHAERPTESKLVDSVEALMPGIIASCLRHVGKPVIVRDGILRKERVATMIDAVCLHMSKIQKANESWREAQIVVKAAALGLLPKPSNYMAGIWVANCPGINNHQIELQPKKNLFRCGYCRVGGGIEQLEEFAAQTKMNFEASGKRTADKRTVRDAITKEISENPNWREATSSGTGFVIGGVKPSSETKPATRVLNKKVK
jgi:hypothetical protein